MYQSRDSACINVKKKIVEILLDEGYINGYEVEDDDRQGVIKIELKYSADKERVTGLKRISKPGTQGICSEERDPKGSGADWEWLLSLPQTAF